MVDVSIIIVNYNTRDLLRNCIESILKNTIHINYEIIVVDNASKDDSITMLKTEFKQVKLIESKVNGGFAYANNLGIKKSKGRYVFLLNSDTIILKDVLEKMIAYMDENKDIGLLGPKLLNGDRTHQTSISAFPTFKREVYHIYKLKNVLKIPFVKSFFVRFGGKLGSKDLEQYMKNFQSIESPEKVQVLVGAALLIRKEVIDDIGMLDERYFMYYEEIDFCYQAHKAGWHRVYYPYGEIVHLIGQSSEKIGDITFYERYRSMILYFRKNYGRSKEILVRINLIIALILRVIGMSFIQIFKSSKIIKENRKVYIKTIKMAVNKKAIATNRY
ncbi:glycosyltransferase family 2 protein [Clostridium sp.]|jgi:GT2 family glycosyltransferase|uniref:glycosyltransferase family 2 protein n=1 Tax=Clostridium sp. TaxID=1506 RepID=UPI002583C2AF|nr:glycosyltransferase family 2 protein [Clostridium sp.]MDF2505034.1 putative glycosyltransferase [Clostridium sp.]